tara:strand:- start:903 stop:1127 length:225 start_codon:yes stop_codon:yes gene_type:complete
MINKYDIKFNRTTKLQGSKWTSLKKLNGWRHYEVININKKEDSIELFAICDSDERAFINKNELKNKEIWKRGWY